MEGKEKEKVELRKEKRKSDLFVLYLGLEENEGRQECFVCLLKYIKGPINYLYTINSSFLFVVPTVSKCVVFYRECSGLLVLL